MRVGDTYYMTASSFNAAPGLPLLRSKDLVNWELAGHALPALVPAGRYAVARHGEGVWAPSLRYHEGKFWIFYPDPDLGIFVTTAASFSGPWSAPRLLLPGKGIIDPTPLWDDDGKAYLLHAWAKSRAGFNNVLTLRRMAPDASGLLDGEGLTLIDGNKIPGYRTLEGPKFYKANGFYYVFAPAGGVEHGWQAVFRARSIDGPYEVRTVMDQGNTPINGPHQGAWVGALDGRDWFLHFQDKGAHGRVVHLQPMRWEDGWPLIGMPSRWRACRSGCRPRSMSSAPRRLACNDNGMPIRSRTGIRWPSAGATELVYTTCTQPAAACGEQPQVVLARAPAALYLRISMDQGARARFSFSTDKVRFTPVGEPFVASKGRWVGAQIGLFSVGTNHGSAASNLDVDYFRIGLATAHAGK